MKKSLFALFFFLLATLSAARANPAVDSSRISCRAMEVFTSEPLGVTAVLFHQSDKAEGPRLGELLVEHPGAQVVFETPDGKSHAATVERVKSCFGRGLLLFSAKDAKLAANQDFVVHFSAPR